jgi:8-oxo-dGTP pyrophosphatase MutT (NUDIX family)
MAEKNSIRRTTARVLPVNRRGEVLLLNGCDPAVPERRYWFTIGGGTEPGESLAAAGVRELREETGIHVEESLLGEPFHRGQHTFTYDGAELVNDSHFFAIRLDDITVTFDGLEGPEIGTIFDARWWRPGALADQELSSAELPELARRAVAAAGAGA